MAKCLILISLHGRIWQTLFSIPLKGIEEFGENEIEGRNI